MPRIGQGLSAVIVFTCAVFFTLAAIGLLTSHDSFPIRTGENMVYGIYSNGVRVGELKMWAEGRELVDNVECFVVRYSVYIPEEDRARSGVIKLDQLGNLRRVRIAEAENGTIMWATEVGYFESGLMRVVVEDNRGAIPLDKDETIVMPENATVGEHIWYLTRFDSVKAGYSRALNFSLMPDATTMVSSRIFVSGEENVETPAGMFDCWVIDGDNTGAVPWPVDRMWISKADGKVVKASELPEETVYLLEKA